MGVYNGDPLARRLAPFVTNLEPHVFEVAWQEDKVDLFQSDFRVVADYLVKRRKHGDEYVPSPQGDGQGAVARRCSGVTPLTGDGGSRVGCVV